MDRFKSPSSNDEDPSQQLSEKADEQRRRCREWLLPFNHLVPSLIDIGARKGCDRLCEQIAADRKSEISDRSSVENHILLSSATTESLLRNGAT